MDRRALIRKVFHNEPAEKLPVGFWHHYLEDELVDGLHNPEYIAKNLEGARRFKEEFVTCGGVALSNLDLDTLECRKHPGLFFAGEVIDVDAITGGFNLQAAWSTGYRAAVSISGKE